MRIKSKDVVAEQWSLAHVDKGGERGNVARDWLESKQVYVIEDNLWDLFGTEGMGSVPSAALRKAPYRCLYFQHRTKRAGMIQSSRARVRVERQVDGYIVDFPRGGDTLMNVSELSKLNVSMCLFEDDQTRFFSFDWKSTTLGVDISRDLDVGLLAGRFRSALELQVRDDALESRILFSDRWGVLGFGPTDFVECCAGLESGPEQLDKVFGSLLYITALNADVRTVYEPGQAKKKLARKASQSTVHEVGFRIARDLGEVRRARAMIDKGEEAPAPADSLDGAEKPSRRVRPHVRRGHWHCYWLGPKDDPTDIEVLWLKPIVINASRGEVQGKIHLPADDSVEAPAAVGYVGIRDQKAQASALREAAAESECPDMSREPNEAQVEGGSPRA